MTGMTTIDALTPVGELVAQRAGRARVFERFGIDYCCHGHLPLAEACEQQGLATDAVTEALRQVDDEPAHAAVPDWSKASLVELVKHILDTHHQYLRKEMPRLTTLMDKVTAVHGERHSSLHECQRVFAGLREELDSHMAKEEMVLFPLIVQMESTQAVGMSHCGSVQNPIRVMEAEHDNAGNALATLRELTGGYAVPADGCASYRALLDGLARLELDLHQHIHKENNILFPRAIRLEARLTASAAAVL